MKPKLSRLALLFSFVGSFFVFSLWVIAQTPTTPSSELVNTGNGRWSWQHPQPQGNELTAINCPTESDCYTGGHLGSYYSATDNRAFVLQSHDGSKSWSGQQLDGHGINGFYCLSSEICYAASFFGQVLKTEDGGQTWDIKVTNTSGHLWNIFCFNSSNCIVVGDNGIIQQTTNGGQSWTTRTSNTSRALKDVTCIDSSVCLIVGGNTYDGGTGDGIILRSQNGGSTWNIATTAPPHTLNALTCYDSIHCVAVGWGGVIYVSKDSGNSWRSATAHTNDILTDVECPSSDKCFLTTSTGQIFYSNNGFIWLLIPTQNEVSLQGISCLSEKQCTAVGSNGIILTTTNGGRDWTSSNQGEVSSTTLWVCYNDGGCWAEYTNKINDIQCFNDGRCLAVGNTGLVLKGDALNQTWYANHINTEQNLRGLSCTGDGLSRICYVTGSGGTVWKSINNGDSWQPTPTGIMSRLFDISCNNSTCFATGDGGVVIKSENAGANWILLSTGTNKDLLAIDCPSTSSCFAVGNNAEIVYTHDSGQSWNKPIQAPDVSTYGKLTGIYCQSDNSCLAVGGDFPPDRTVVFHTSDGGINWSLSLPGTIFWPRGIDCTLSGVCVSVGNSGAIVSSLDGGYSWQEESSGIFMSLFGVSCLEDGSCFVAGEQANILSATVWPELTVKHDFIGNSFAHGEQITGTIQIFNSGAITASQILVTNTLPASLQSTGPLEVTWGTEVHTIESPTWPNILSGLNITLTPGSLLSISFPLTIANPQQTVQKIESQVMVDAVELPRPLEQQTSLTLAQNSIFLPTVVTSEPATACNGPYVDDFSSIASGWPGGDTGTTAYNYSAGEYSMLHRQANQWFAITRGDYWQSDLLLALDGYELANRGIWGLLFGMDGSWNSFYTFEIIPATQQWYVFYYNATNGWVQLASGNGTYILQGQNKNNLLIQGADNNMYFYINNYLVYQMSEKTGYIGLTGGSFDANTYLRYDDYLFQSGDCSPISQSQSWGKGLTVTTFAQDSAEARPDAALK